LLAWSRRRFILDRFAEERDAADLEYDTLNAVPNELLDLADSGLDFASSAVANVVDGLPCRWDLQGVARLRRVLSSNVAKARAAA
jgi:hypothetical protein